MQRQFILAPGDGLNGHHGRDAQDAPGDVDSVDAFAPEEMLVNMGPQHPMTHGVLRLALITDGETVLEAVPHIGYLHRCAEKIGENVTYAQFVPYTDRMDYLAAMNNNTGWAMAVERLAAIEIPRRAAYIRVIMCELNRIASHLVSMGAFAMDTGAFAMFHHAFREREFILDLFEAACGARLTYAYVTVGGVGRDLPARWTEYCIDFLNYFEPKLKEFDRLLTFNHVFIKRTANIGVLSAEAATRHGASGPMLRGSGVAWDLRKSAPFYPYETFDFDVPVGDGRMGALGDCWDRYYARVREMRESARIVRQAIAAMPTGAHRADLPPGFAVPPGEIYMETEGARGRLGFYIESRGGPVPYRVKVRGPSFCNLSLADTLCRNALLADVPVIIGSIDVVMGETDR